MCCSDASGSSNALESNSRTPERESADEENNFFWPLCSRLLFQERRVSGRSRLGERLRFPETRYN